MEDLYESGPKQYDPAVVGITLYRFFHILKQIEEEQEEEQEEEKLGYPV